MFDERKLNEKVKIQTGIFVIVVIWVSSVLNEKQLKVSECIECTPS